MTLKTRLARAEQVARSRWRPDVRQVLDGVILPETGDRIGFLTEQVVRAHAILGRDLDPRELAAVMRPLMEQLTADELRELAEQAWEART